MNTILENNYVLFDKANHSLYRYAYGRVVIFETRDGAEKECHGNEYVTRCTDLPQDLQELILNQIK